MGVFYASSKRYFKIFLHSRLDVCIILHNLKELCNILSQNKNKNTKNKNFKINKKAQTYFEMVENKNLIEYNQHQIHKSQN